MLGSLGGSDVGKKGGASSADWGNEGEEAGSWSLKESFPGPKPEPPQAVRQTHRAPEGATETQRSQGGG